MSQAPQTILLVSNNGELCAEARYEVARRRPEVRVAAVSSVAAALVLLQKINPSVILLSDEPDVTANNSVRSAPALESMVQALAPYAPVVVLGLAANSPGPGPEKVSGAPRYALRHGDWPEALVALLNAASSNGRARHPGPADLIDAKNFGEVLRHELNNPLTGILGNAELLLAEILKQRDGKLPMGGQQRVETIAALAVRLRETVRQLSLEWEARREPVTHS